VKRSGASIVGAALVVSAWLTAAGCLNPRPEELPSEQDPALDLDESENLDPGGPSAPLTPGDSPSTSVPGATGAPPSQSEAGPADAGPPDAGARPLETGVDAEPAPETEPADPPE
jgi:hypothetical protein